jgi:spore coat protein U-like protein
MTMRRLISFAMVLTALVLCLDAAPHARASAPETLTIDPVPEPQLGLSCTISETDVLFGNYSVFNASPTDANGTVKYSCTLGVLVRVTLDKGSAPSFDPRTMKNASNEALTYNLYLDSGHATIWEDNGTNQISETLIALVPKTRTVFGRITPQQDVSAGGPYTDHVTATIIF